MKAKTSRSPSSRSTKPLRKAYPRRSVKRTADLPAPPMPPGSPSLARGSMPKSVSGQVVEERSGLPLAGVAVKWTMSYASGPGKARPVVLGSAATDGDGRFVIESAADVDAQTALCLIDHRGDGNKGKTLLSLVDGRGKVLGRPFEVTAQASEIALYAPTNEKASKPQWKALANYLITNRMMLVKDVAEQLSRPLADSPVNGWTAPERASRCARCSTPSRRRTKNWPDRSICSSKISSWKRHRWRQAASVERLTFSRT